jgi:hypothetical protein
VRQHKNTVNGSIITNAISWGGTLGICICAVFCIYFLAGKTTAANITINVLAKFCFPWVAAAGGIIYGKVQENAKRNQIKRDSERITELEKRLDPDRISSNLTERGQTRLEDQL